MNLTNLSELLKKYEHIDLNIDGHASYEGDQTTICYFLKKDLKV